GTFIQCPALSNGHRDVKRMFRLAQAQGPSQLPQVWRIGLQKPDARHLRPPVWIHHFTQRPNIEPERLSDRGDRIDPAQRLQLLRPYHRNVRTVPTRTLLYGLLNPELSHGLKTAITDIVRNVQQNPA